MDNKTWLWAIGIFLLFALPAGIIIALDQTEDKLTYVSSTEYISGDQGQVIIRLTDFQGNPLSATCKDTIQYPDKTVFLPNQTMTPAGYGNYYHNFTLPGTAGVYTSNVQCTYGARTLTHSKTFHVSLLNTAIQARFDALQLNITSSNVNILQAINQSEEDLRTDITTNYNTLLDTRNNLSNQISTVQENIDNNFTYLFTLFDQLNTTGTQEHNTILNLLQSINTTTTNTQTTLNTFQTDTTNNFQDINNTLIGVETTTNQVLTIVNNLTLDVDNLTIDIDNQIAYLTNLTINNHNITQTDLTNIQNLIIQLNTTTTNNFETIIQNYNTFNTTINQKLDWITNITNMTNYEVALILQYLNISFNNINIIPESNNCWVGGQWVMFAEVKNHFGTTQTDQDVTCQITTTNWGGPDNMTWQPPRNQFKYYHPCDIAGTIDWTITCNYI